MKLIRLTAAMLVALTLTISASALYTPTTTSYDPSIDYMAEMLDAASDGSQSALGLGKLYEKQRNTKILNNNLEYEPTNFFVDGRSGDEILEDLNNYISPKSPEMEYAGQYYITGYDACYRCCGKTNGITASGTVATVGRTVAMRGIAYGTKIYIEGLGYYTVEDTGCGYGVVDVFCSNHSECYAITGSYNVYFVK